MAQTDIFYRLRGRNEDDTSDLIVLSSFPGDTNALLCEAPEGEGQSLDPIMGTLEVGGYTWQTIDRHDGGETYTVTALLSDADARNQLLSHKWIGEWSTDGSTWDQLHTGFLNDIKLSDATTYTFIVGDTDRRERDAVLFKTITEQFGGVSNIIGGPVEADPPVAWTATPSLAWGPILDYGPARMTVIGNSSGGTPNPANLINPDNRVTLGLVSANLPPRYLGQQGVWNGKIPNPAEYIDQQTYQYYEADADGIYATTGGETSQPWGSFPQLEVRLTRVSDSVVFRTFPIAQATRKVNTITSVIPLGDEKALVANSNDWLIIAWDVGTMGAQPSLATAFDVLVRPIVISEQNPLHLRGHPVDLHILANEQEGIAYDATSAAATKAALGPLFYGLRITAEWEYYKFVEMLKASAGYATRYNADSEQEFLPTRITQPASVATVTTAEIIGDEHGDVKDVIFKVSEGSAIKGLDYKLQQFRLWSKDLDSASDRPIDGVVATDVTINGSRRDESVKGSKIVQFDVPGMIMLPGDAGVTSQPMKLRAWIIQGGDVIIDRAGWGWAEGELEVLATVPGQVGDYLDLEHPAQVNAKLLQSPITQRGGTRRVQITKRVEMSGTSKLTVKDAGNLAQDPPEAGDTGVGNATLPVPELSLAPSVASPFTIATVTESNVVDFSEINADTELQYLVQTATPASTDEGDFFGPLLSSTGADTIDAPAIASGETIWVRGRATLTNGSRGEWSTWISITLGPDTTGTGDTLPSFTLALAVDGAGSLSATASSVDAAIILVYFLAGAAGGAPPPFDDVVATTPDTLAPFAMTGLAMMVEGEVRTVGAVGEDALGNRTLLVLASITRAVNSGNASGTPANTPMTMLAGPPVVIRNVGSSLREPKGFKVTRMFRNTANMLTGRIQHNCWEGGSDGTEIHFCYFDLALDPGALSPLETGILVRADRERFPEPGNFLAITPAAQGVNVLTTFATKGGDGISTLKTSDLFIEPNALLAPAIPPTPTGDTADLPSGGAFGNLILDLNAFSLATELSLVDGDPVTSWPDDSVSGNDASQAFGQSAPTYKSDGLGAGKPSVRFAAATLNGLSYNVPNTVSLTETRYFVVLPTTGLGTGGRSFDDGVLFSGHGNNNISDIGVGLRSDGKLAFSVGENAVTTTFRSVVTGADTRGSVRIICVIRNGSAGYIFVDDMSTAAGTLTALDAQEFDDYPTEFIGIGGSVQVTSIAADYGRDVAYDAAHGEAERAVVAVILEAIWISGTLPGTGGGGSGGGGGTGGGTATPPPVPISGGTTPPDYLMTFTDPNTGATITRITGTPGVAVPTVGGVWPNVAYHNYPKDQPFNADETLIVLKQVSNEWGPGSYLFLDGTTYAPLFTSTGGSSGGGEKRWHPTNADVMIGLNSNGRVVWWNPSTDTTTTKVAAVSGYTSNEMGPNEGNPSYDGSMLVAKAIRTSDGNLVARVLNVDAGTAGVVIDLTAAGCTNLDWVSISAGGNFVVAEGNFGLGRSDTRKIWDASTGTLIATWNDYLGQHVDLGVDDSSDEVMAYAVASGSADLHHIIKRRLSDGTVVSLSGGAKTSFNGHIGCRQTSAPWAVYSQNDNSGYEYDGLIVRLKLTGTPTVEKVCSHNCINIDYDSAPKAVASPSGTRIIFASNWGNTSGRPMQTYIVESW